MMNSDKKKIQYVSGEKLNERSKLLYLQDVESKGPRRALFECQCGKRKEILISNVKSGKVISCGCVDYARKSRKSLNPAFGDELCNDSYLTFLFETERKSYKCGQNKRMAFFSCECGNIIQSAIHAVASGRSKSCGCRVSKITSENKTTHGFYWEPWYSSYRSMITRCYLKGVSEYKNYGGRGIIVCNRWLGENGPENFLSDMGERPDGFTLDRIDVNGNYSPSNCRWADSATQQFNKRTTDRNKSGRVGVWFDKRKGKYFVSINKYGKRLYTGYFKNFHDAVSKREELELKYYGQILTE